MWERHAELLANELQRMADTERSNRDAIRTDGAKFEVAMPAEIYRAGVEVRAQAQPASLSAARAFGHTTARPLAGGG